MIPTPASASAVLLPSSPERAQPQPSPARTVRAADRAVDAAAIVLVGVGIVIFLLARHALIEISNGTYAMPVGTTWVAETDLHVARVKAGMLLVSVGTLLGIVAAARHAWGKGE